MKKKYTLELAGKIVKQAHERGGLYSGELEKHEQVAVLYRLSYLYEKDRSVIEKYPKKVVNIYSEEIHLINSLVVPAIIPDHDNI